MAIPEADVLKILAIALLTGLTACVHSDEAARLQSRSVKVAAVAKPTAVSHVRTPSAMRVGKADTASCRGVACRKRVGMLLGVSY